MKDFHELIIWQRSHPLTLSVYKQTSNFPKDELYGLTSQIRRACTSIPANLAEGFRRHEAARMKPFDIEIPKKERIKFADSVRAIRIAREASNAGAARYKHNPRLL